MNEAWYAALFLIADESVPTYWRLCYGAEPWWMPAWAELLPNGFASQPLTYAEVISVTLFDTDRRSRRVARRLVLAAS